METPALDFRMLKIYEDLPKTKGYINGSKQTRRHSNDRSNLTGGIPQNPRSSQ